MKLSIKNTLLSVLSVALSGVTVFAQGNRPDEIPGASVVEDAIWAHDLLYGTAVTPTGFKKHPEHSVDIIYSFARSGLKEQRSVSEAAPGDTDYNGGRWHVYMVTFTEVGMDIHDPDGDGVVNFELTSAEQVLAHAALGHLTIGETDVYFSCPLRGPGHQVE